MAQTTTSAPQQAVNIPAVDFRQLMGSDVKGPGIRTATDLQVAQHASGANMTVDVSVGSCLIADAHGSGGGFYSYTLGTSFNAAIAAADPSNPRIDRIVVQINDSFLGDGSNTIGISVVKGVATGGANLTNLSGAAAVPSNALLLANVLVPAAASSIVTADIANVSTPLCPSVTYYDYTGSAPSPAATGGQSTATWNKPASAQMVMVIVIASGGGGGGGRSIAAASIGMGGGGGGGGAAIVGVFPAVQLGATETITVAGGGGGGGPANPGQNGGAGNQSSFGSWLTSGGGSGGGGGNNSGFAGAGGCIGTAPGGGAPGAPTCAILFQFAGGAAFGVAGAYAVGASVAGNASDYGGASGGGYSSTGAGTGPAGGSSIYGGAGGGAGGGHAASGAAQSGGAGGSGSTFPTGGGGAGGTTGPATAGGNGTAPGTSSVGPYTGTAGGGGGAATSGTGAAGGSGAIGCGGGGGGTGVTAGSGGNGGNGRVIVISW